MLDPESNIQFGEGGAGAYSDGKLFSRVNNSNYANRVLDTFIKFGAPEEIGYIRKPHVGTDVLCRIVSNIRSHILERGGEIQYSSKMTDMLITEGKVLGCSNKWRKGISLVQVSILRLEIPAVIHLSCCTKKVLLFEQKPIAVGVRVEHPVETINLIRYGNKYRGFAASGLLLIPSPTPIAKRDGVSIHSACAPEVR